MIVEVLADALLGTIAERGVSAVLESRSGSSLFRAESSAKDAKAALREHLVMVKKWSSEINFRDLLRSKNLAESFVDLECALGQIAEGGKLLNEPSRLVSSLLNTQHNIVILGRPGAGKTTSLQRLALTTLERYTTGNHFTPIVLRLRDLRPNDSILGRVAAIAQVHLAEVPSPPDREGTIDSKIREREFRETQRRAVTAFLEGIKGLLFIDGLDECLTSLRDEAEQDINDLMEHSSEARIIVSCRTADYGFSFPASTYTLLPLTQEQVRRFSAKWLGRQQANVFAAQLAESPFQGAEVVPITIAHLCAIFERRGAIPRQPRFLYQKLVRLLLEEWDEQRGVKRVSRYGDFETERKLEFLRQIAYELTIGEYRGTFTHAQLEKAYLRSHSTFDLPREECSRVAREIESHTGLILQAGEDRFEFAHKSIQEFLTAEYLLRLPRVDRAHFLKLGDELAVATALSSRADLYVESVAEVLFGFPVHESRARFAGVFLSRLFAERPDFPPTWQLGWTLIVLRNAAFQVRGGYAHSRVNPSSTALLGHESARQAIEEAVRHSKRVHQAGGLFIRPESPDQLPTSIASYVAARPGPGLPVDQPLFQELSQFRTQP